MDALAPGASAGAAADLVAEAGTISLCVEAERLQAEAMFIRQRTQALQRRAPRAEDPVNERQGVGIDFIGAGDAQAPAVEGERTQCARPPELAVIQRCKLPLQPRFGEHRAPPPDPALPIHPAHAMRPAGRLIEMTQRARTNRAALAVI